MKLNRTRELWRATSPSGRWYYEIERQACQDLESLFQENFELRDAVESYKIAEASLRNKIAELDRYRNGYQGSCYACEPVGMLNQRLRELIGEFFKLLDTVEESDSGREFHPVQITCCRTMMMEPLNKVLKEMKEQVQ